MLLQGMMISPPETSPYCSYFLVVFYVEVERSDSVVSTSEFNCTPPVSVAFDSFLIS